MGIPDGILIKADWRVYGSDAPIDWEGITVWPVDPLKHIRVMEDTKKLVDDIKNRFPITIIDCAGSFDVCSKTGKDEYVVVLIKEGDASDQTTQHWLRTYDNTNAFVFGSVEQPALNHMKDGYILGKI